ncbi:MAG: DUF4125 family protein [Oscillospiraceae bacterium]|jgi:hypothetical protein|nr:DUF4125 family protein [Oscillospiraceae bacterium]
MQAELIDGIVLLEWNMFQSVNEGNGARASCQDDEATFRAMRRAQFLSWSEPCADSYFKDLTFAASEDRNLIAEKYIHMMKTTSPSQYEKLLAAIKPPGAEICELAARICAELVAQTAALRKKYPYVAGAGRPLYSEEDFSGVVSVQTYQYGELLTYSAQTLRRLEAHIAALKSEGQSLAEEILRRTAEYYGYTSLEQAENAQRKHIESQPIIFSAGCDCDSCGGACNA